MIMLRRLSNVARYCGIPGRRPEILGYLPRLASSQPPEDTTTIPIEDKRTGHAKFLDRFTETPPKTEENETFAQLLRNSKFIDLGDPEGKVVTGRIFHIVDDDLYIDFGWKFHCVCPRPKKNSSDYVRGARVRLAIRDLELSSRFLGFERDLTLLEADCILLGLVQEQGKRRGRTQADTA